MGKRIGFLKHIEHDRLLNLLESIPCGILIIDRECDIQYVYPVIKKEFGPIDGRKCYTYLYHRSELCPFCINDIVFPRETIQWDRYPPKNDRYYNSFDMPFRNPDGSISDFGSDVSKKMRHQIFDPCYTTKSNNSGIGLSICHRIITDHGGSLELANSEPGGTKFILKIPASEGTDKK